MAKKTIFTVGFDLPGDEFDYVPFESDRSLLDADIVLYQVGFGELFPNEDYEGTPLFSKSKSPRIAQYVSHWRSELAAFVNGGKLAIIFLKKPERYFRYTGGKTFSGTGRSQVTTNVVTSVSSYDAVPNITNVEAKSGKEVRLTPEASYFAPYWKEFASASDYEAFIDGKFSHKVLVTKTGDKVVAAAFRGKGMLLFLPPLHLDEKTFVRYDAKTAKSSWTSDALKFGKRLIATLVALADSIKTKSATPPPAWVQDSAFATDEESQIEATISKVTSQVSRLQEKRTELEQRLAEAGQLRRLIYETGSPLESAVREALTLFGFSAKQYKESGSEFDVVFESAEGRFIGEVEGKDNKAVNIDKLDQLERNLREDFARDEVKEFARGVLFGNPERLTPPTKRGQSFTDKCMTAAKRSGIALVRTADMFAPARYLREKGDPEFATACREAILRTAGDIVTFPAVPEPPQPERVEAESRS